MRRNQRHFPIKAPRRLPSLSMFARTVRLSPYQMDRARFIGDGDVSRGIRYALNHYFDVRV